MKQRIVRFFNAYGLREYLMLLKYNRFTVESQKEPMLISCIDGRRNTQGLTDRFKGIISIFALSKALNLPFRCIYTHPFNLKDYLLPNEYNWLPNDDELSISVSHVRFKILRKQPTLKRLLHILPTEKQIHVYANVDYLDEINRRYNQNFRWEDLFKELFIPASELESQIQHHLDRLGENYLACVFRFQSLLGDFREYNYQSLSNEQQQQLIGKNREELQKLIQNSGCPVLVTSDSMKFINAIKNIPGVYTLPGKVVHLDCTFNEEKEVYMKSFIDFFMISRAKKIYSVGTRNMYQTEFPLYAAKVSNVPFERILIDLP